MAPAAVAAAAACGRRCRWRWRWRLPVAVVEWWKGRQYNNDEGPSIAWHLSRTNGYISPTSSPAMWSWAAATGTYWDVGPAEEGCGDGRSASMHADAPAMELMALCFCWWGWGTGIQSVWVCVGRLSSLVRSLR